MPIIKRFFQTFRKWLSNVLTGIGRTLWKIATHRSALTDETKRILPTDSGFQLYDRKEFITEVSWDDIKQIDAFKKDLLTYDMICLGFETHTNTYVELWEEMAGFMELAEKMQDKFSSIPPGWYLEIMMPVFEESRITLWSEKTPQPSE